MSEDTQTASLAAQHGASAAYYLVALASVAAQQNNPQDAIRLLSAARSQLEANRSGWLHSYVPRTPHDDAVLAALRARAGDVAYHLAQAGRVRRKQPRQTVRT